MRLEILPERSAESNAEASGALVVIAQVWPLDVILARVDKSTSLFRKQIFEIRLGQTAREALFAEHVGYGLGFALL